MRARDKYIHIYVCINKYVDVDLEEERERERERAKSSPLGRTTGMEHKAPIKRFIMHPYMHVCLYI